MSNIKQLLLMNYDQVVNTLLKKYGLVTKDYLKESYLLVIAGIGNSQKGLYLHQIAKNHQSSLIMVPMFARKSIIDYQRDLNKLVYCNLLEHLVLHLKMLEYIHSEEICDLGTINNFFIPKLNDIYCGIVYEKKWEQKMAEIVYPMKKDYFKCLQKIITMNLNYPLLTNYDVKFQVQNKTQNEVYFNELRKLGIKK